MLSLEELESKIKTLYPDWRGCVETWDEISKQDMRNIRNKLKAYGFIPFLYELSQDSNTLIGHWMIMIDRGDAIEVFDSHGSKIDPLNWYKDKKILKHVQTLTAEKIEPILSNKLFDVGYEFVDWNTKELQKKQEGITTCGLWVIFRLIYHKLFPLKDIDHFVNFALSLSHFMDLAPDEMIVDLL
jgi:hypothetical protein